MDLWHLAPCSLVNVYLSTKLHTAISQKSIFLMLTTVRTTDLDNCVTAYRCMCFPCLGAHDGATVVSDNCCHCNYAALRRMVEIGEVEVIYATYHVDVGETPFFVAVDFTRRKIVISIRGTLSMKVGFCTMFVLLIMYCSQQIMIL